MAEYSLPVYGIREPRPGARWRQLFEATWPAYRRWYRSEGLAARPTPVVAGAALARHLPELLPTWAQLSEQTGFDLEAATMLSGWDLPAFAPAACSQIVLDGAEPGLVRNYDYAPGLFESVIMSTDHLQPVIGTSDCLWGLLDGMNGAGLVVSLTFGGDRSTGLGFAIPVVVRYLLETCTTVVEARAALDRIPVSMAYNLTMLDATGDAGTAYVGPGRTAEFRPQPLATNHRWSSPEDPEHARRYGSVERFDRLVELRRDGAVADEVVAALLSAPMYARDYRNGFGTLYTAEYRPRQGEVTYHWPERSWTRSFDSPDDVISVQLVDA